MEGEHLCTVVLIVLQNIVGDTDFIVKFTILTSRQQKYCVNIQPQLFSTHSVTKILGHNEFRNYIPVIPDIG